MNLPQNYCLKMQDLLKDEYEAYLESFKRSIRPCIRINTLKISVEDFRKISPFRLTAIPWIENGFRLEENDRPGKHPYYDAGLYYIQEASAMTPARALPINKGDRVLDCCAAPGGKSSELLAKLDHSGFLLSNDISVSRAYALLKNLQHCGAMNFSVAAEDIAKIATQCKESFDKILVDAPCSGEGMFHKDPSLIESYLIKDSSYYAPLQKEILENAYRCLKKGGMMLYSTCTFSKEENEEVIEDLLSHHNDIHVKKIDLDYEGFAHGLSENTKEALRLYPHKLEGEGHFLCLLEKDGESRKEADTPIFSKAPETVRSFLKHTALKADEYDCTVIKERLYLTKRSHMKIKGLRLLHEGLLAGEYKKERFEPGQMLALMLGKNSYDNVLDLEPGDPRLGKYLKGETIECDKKGLVLVCVSGYGLGFGKGDGVMLKNKIDKGWIKA